VLGISFATHDQLGTSALIVALLAGCIGAALINLRHLHKPGQALTEGGTGALIAIGNTAAVVGFGTVAKSRRPSMPPWYGLPACPDPA
jgi:hypothetical protein